MIQYNIQYDITKISIQFINTTGKLIIWIIILNRTTRWTNSKISNIIRK